jgi:hypothetical protein
MAVRSDAVKRGPQWAPHRSMYRVTSFLRSPQHRLGRAVMPSPPSNKEKVGARLQGQACHSFNPALFH